MLAYLKNLCDGNCGRWLGEGNINREVMASCESKLCYNTPGSKKN